MNRLLHTPTNNFFKIFFLASSLLFFFSDAKTQTVATPTFTAVTSTTATLGGDVTGTLTHRGTRWNTASPVATNNELEEASTTAGVFTQARTGLPPATKIFFTAYARNGGTTSGVTTEGSFFTEPTQLTGGQFTAAATSPTDITLSFPSADSWKGTGATAGYVIYRNSGSAPSLGALADGAAPPADEVGDKIATITDGTATSFNNTTGLSAQTDYYYTIIPFVWDNVSALTYNYNVTTPQTANDFTFSTEPASHPTNGTFTVTAISPTQINLAFDASSSDGYIVLRREDGSDPTTAGVVDGVNPASLTLPAGTTLAGTSTSTSFNNTGLTAATRYRYLILPYNANGATDAGTYNYKIDGTPVTPKNDWTFATQPSGHATGTITATPFSSTQINLSFNNVATSGISNAIGYIVLVKSSAIVVGDLAGLSDGAVPTGFGLFEEEINSTGTGTFNHTGLTPNTTYHYAIIPYNRISDDETYNFLTTSGFITGSATTNDISATFTNILPGTLPVPSSSSYNAGTTLQVIAGFSVTSDGTQKIDDLVFQITGLTANPNQQFTDVYLYRSTTAGVVGTEIESESAPTATLDFNWGGLSDPNRTVNSTPVYYYLVVDLRSDLTLSSTGVTVALSQANVNTDVGDVNSFSINKPITFNTSQSSDIILNGTVTPLIGYRTRQDPTVHNTDQSKSVRLATYQLRDGGGSDPDNKNTNLTSLTISLTHPEYVRAISLFDDDTDTEIPGTDQLVSGLSTITFTPSSPISTSADNGDRNLAVRATFQAVVADNDQISLAITGAIANTSGSGFSPVAGWLSTTTDPANNHIDVVATKLVFSPTLPPTVTIATNFSATVKAFDGLNNIDVDRTDHFDLTESGPGVLTSSGGTTLSPNLVAGQFSWNDLRLSLSGSYPMLASDDAYDDLLGGDASGSITISSPAANITQPADPVICFGNASSGKVLGNIVITETDPAGISGSNGSYTFSLALPSNFIFDQSVTTGLGVSGTDLSSPSGYSYPGANIVQFSFTLNGTANINTITIGGLKIYHLHPGIDNPLDVGPFNITRLGGTATIAGAGPGVVLGEISAKQDNPDNSGVTITVGPALITDPPVDPNLTLFNVSGSAVKLISSTPAGSVFTGSGVTYVNPDYRFNPNSLPVGTYPITVTQTAANGCQSVNTKNLEVIISGIVNLNSSYCTSDAPSPPMSVSQAYIDQVAGPGWSFDHFIFFDWYGTGWTPISSPANNVFNPSLPVYLNSYQGFKASGYPGIAVAFAICNGTTYPCNGLSTRQAPYQFVDLKTAPNVGFTLPSNIYAYCEDNVPVTLTGTPANSNNIVNDFFTASGGQGASISHSLVSGEEVWVFSPATVSGVTSSTSQTFNITYQYREPSTGCSNTLSQPVTVHARPSIVPTGNITKSPVGPPNNTTIQLCQGSPLGSFGTTDATYNYRWYADPPNPGNFKGIGPNFNPPVNNSIAGPTTFHVTRERNGCESINAPLALSVNVVAPPVAPSPNFSNSTRQYCVGTAINDTHLEVPGSNVRWYNSLNALVYSGSTPTAGDLGLSTAAANQYTFSVTQTEVVNSCQGSGTPITVTVKALPIIQIVSDATNVNKICTTAPDGISGGIVSFSAFDQADLGNPAINGTWSGTGLAGTLNPFPTLGSVNLDPLTLASGPYTLNYNYTNSANCANSGLINITIAPKITPNVTVGSVCDQSAAVVINTSSISSGTTTIDFAEWNFGDGAIIASGAYGSIIDPLTYTNTSGTYESPQHIYPNTGTFQISGTLITSDGCRYQLPASVPVTVSPLPVANFTSTNVCVNSLTSFNATTSIPVSSYNWDFALNNVLAAGSAITSGAGNASSFTYSATGKDTVSLVVITSANCRDTVKKAMFIVPNYTPIAPDDSYAQDFTVNDGWIAGGINSSWELGVPTGAPAPLTGNAWDTKIGGKNNPNESSWVMSGCFDFSSSTKPVISLDIWSDVPNGVDGAVLQYNISGNIEDNIPNSSDPDGDWVTVGEVNKGINWYNENGISNSPGNQTTISTGWTGEDTQWRKAIYKLDNVSGNQKVVFRIAFASSQPRGEGFTFDNVFVGERSRVVLLENFTNSYTSTTVPAPTAHNAFYRNFGNVLTGELVKVQYHTAFPGDDPINKLNQQMNNARAAFYGITEVPTARLDGDFRNGIISNWLVGVNDDRVLTPAALRLNISAVKDGDVVKINTSIENTTSQPISLTGTHLFTVIVQKSITDATLLSTSGNAEFTYVAKQMLPNTAGITLTSDLAAGATYIGIPELIWDNPNGDAIVVFIQSIEANNKNVYQAIMLDSPPLPEVITSIEDPAYEQKINLFPNPANSEINIQLPAAVTQRTPVRMIDTYGRTVFENSFATGERSKTINTSELTEGVYIVQIDTPDGNTARRKIMVIHR